MIHRINVLIATLWLAFAPAYAQVGQIPGWPPKQHFSSGGGPSLDGSVAAHGSGATDVTPTLTTTKGSGEIIVAIGSNSVGATLTTTTGLTCTLRFQTTVSTFGFVYMAEYGCPYVSNVSGTFTVTPTTSALTAVVAFGISTVTTFDSGGPVNNGNAPTAITIANATNNFIYTINGLNSSTDSSTLPWILISSASGAFMLVQYQVGPSGSYTGTTTSGHTAGYIADAMH